MLYNKLTEQEISAIDYRIMSCVRGHGNRCTNMQHMLRFWNADKENLANILNGNLIIEKPILFNKSIDELCNEMDEKMPHHLRTALNKISDYYYKQWDFANCCAFDQKKYNSRWTVDSLISTWNLCSNRYNNETTDITLPNGEETRVQRGCKPMKIIKKLFAAMGYDSSLYEDLRIFQSQILNQKKLEGTLCLSIHPLDFMTMSDNNEDWSSCMSWDNDGCYRIGTVEMMNSPYVVMAYLKSDNCYYYINNLKWNSKKWRCLYIVEPNQIITSIKGYPYYNESLLSAAGEWLVELVNNAGGNFDIASATDYEYAHIGEYSLDFCTNGMYNDFGCATHWGVVSKTAFDKYITLNYSGASECMWCGDSFEVESDEEGTLSCPNCNGYIHCDECGCSIHPDETHSSPDGDGIYCSCCYEDLFTTENLTYEACYVEDVKYVYILPNESVAKSLIDGTSQWYNYHGITLRDKEDYDEVDWLYHFKSTDVEIQNNANQPYIYSSDLTEDGFNKFIGSINREVFETTGRITYNH